MIDLSDRCKISGGLYGEPWKCRTHEGIEFEALLADGMCPTRRAFVEEYGPLCAECDSTPDEPHHPECSKATVSHCPECNEPVGNQHPSSCSKRRPHPFEVLESDCYRDLLQPADEGVGSVMADHLRGIQEKLDADLEILDRILERFS